MKSVKSKYQKNNKRSERKKLEMGSGKGERKKGYNVLLGGDDRACLSGSVVLLLLTRHYSIHKTRLSLFISS